MIEIDISFICAVASVTHPVFSVYLNPYVNAYKNVD